MSDLARRLARLQGGAAGAADASPSPAPAPSLAERIARLRVRAATIAAAQPTDADVARLLGGDVVAPHLVRVTRRHALPLLHGRATVRSAVQVAEGVRVSAALTPLPEPASLLLLDTETTGLAGGTGTLAFLVGVATVQDASIEVTQFLLTAFAGEAALLDCIGPLMAACAWLVTFNGKSFDLPLLRTRARLAGRVLAPVEPAHLDLLHVARRRLREDWADCRLRTAEEEALGFTRTDDLPGAEVPAAWQRWLQRRDPALLPRILDHNREDLLSLAALLSVLAGPTRREAPLLKQAGISAATR